MEAFVIFTLDLILTLLPGQFQEVQSLDKLSDHDIVAGTLKVFIPPRKKSRHNTLLINWVIMTLLQEL